MQYGSVDKIVACLSYEVPIKKYFHSDAFFASEENRLKMKLLLLPFSDIAFLVADTTDVNKKPKSADYFKLGETELAH